MFTFIKPENYVMKTLVLSLFVMLTAATTAVAQAEITFDSKSVDYGKIEKGADGQRTFSFTNTGSEPLIVNRVYSSCGCTVPSKPEEAIAPGERGEIVVKYDTKRVGPIRKTLSVYSNASEPIVAITIVGEVMKAGEGSVLEKKTTTGPRS